MTGILAWCFVCQSHVPEGHSSDECRDRIAANRAKSLAVLDVHPAPIPDTPLSKGRPDESRMDRTHGPGRRHTRNGHPMIAAEWDDPAMPALAWWRRKQPYTQISGGPSRVCNEPQEGVTRRYVGFVDPAPKPDDDTAGAPNTIPGVW